MEQSESLELDDRILKALNHDIRRKILLELFEHGWAGYSELVRVLKLTTGVFYHHIRLLEGTELVVQSEGKIYEITPKGIQAIEFLKKSFSLIEESQLGHWFAYYNLFSNVIDSFPLFGISIQLFFICCGLLWLGFSHQFGLIGYFIISFDNTILPIIFSFTFTFMNLIIIFAYFLITSKRSINKITLTAHILFPQTIIVLIVVILSLLPILTIFETETPFFGIIITFIFQIFSLTYYLHVLRKKGTRSLEKTIIVLLVLQYGNLLILYLFI